MIVYKYRQLQGFYRGKTPTSFADYNAINNGMLELSKDLPSLDQRISLLEGNVSGILTNANFTPNSINGNILIAGSIPGTAIASGSITGSQIITNSLTGITDANIASGANINPSKINVSLISHTQLENIGANTHPQIDSDLSQLFNDIGDTPGVGLSIPLQTQINTFNNTATTLTNNLQTLTNYIAPQTLNTHAQTVAPAINELVTALGEIGASGFGITGPVTAPQNSIATWGSTNQKLNASSAFIDNTGNLSIQNNLYFFNSGNPTIGSPSNGVGTIYVNNGLVFNGAAAITASGSHSLTLQSNGTGSIYATSNNQIQLLSPSGVLVSGALNVLGNIGTLSSPVPNEYVTNLYATNIITTTSLSSAELILTSGNKTYLTITSDPIITNPTIYTSGYLTITSPSGITINGTTVTVGNNIGATMQVTAGGNNISLNAPNGSILLTSNTNIALENGGTSDPLLILSPVTGIITDGNLYPTTSGTNTLGFDMNGNSMPYASGNFQHLYIDSTPSYPTSGKDSGLLGSTSKNITASLTANSLIFVQQYGAGIGTTQALAVTNNYPTQNFTVYTVGGVASAAYNFYWFVIN